MRVAFRTDAAPHIGLGHFMRCLTLADRLVDNGASVRFLSRHLGPLSQDLIRARNYPLTMLTDTVPRTEVDGPPHSHWLGVAQSIDAEEVLRSLRQHPADWVVVDHYSLDHRWEAVIRAKPTMVLAIDDLADRIHDCDALLDQNLHRQVDTRYASKLPPGCLSLLGPRFALLRPEFSRLRDSIPARTGHVKRVFISLGGADSSNCTQVVVDAVAASCPPLLADVVIGPGHPAANAIQTRCREVGFTCHINPSAIADLMARADLAVGAAGSTSWERCCLGLPSICMAIADNQVSIAESLDDAGAAVNLGLASDLNCSDITAVLDELRARPSRVRAMSEAARTLTDGHGAERVCRSLHDKYENQRPDN